MAYLLQRALGSLAASRAGSPEVVLNHLIQTFEPVKERCKHEQEREHGQSYMLTRHLGPTQLIVQGLLTV